MSNTQPQPPSGLTPAQVQQFEKDLKLAQSGGLQAPSLPGGSTAAPAGSTTYPSWDTTQFGDLYGVSRALAEAPVTAMAPGAGGPLDGMPSTSVGAALAWFNHLGQTFGTEQVYAIQSMLFNAKILTDIKTPGVVDTATETAFRTMLQHAVTASLPAQAYLDMAQTQGNYAIVDQALQSYQKSLEGAIVKTKAEHFTVTSAADISNSFARAYENVNGIAPTTEQSQAFIEQFQAEQKAKVSGVYQGERKQLQGDLTFVNSALSKLSVNGVGDFVAAFKAAMTRNHASIGNVPELNTQQAGAVSNNLHTSGLSMHASGGIYSISQPVWKEFGPAGFQTPSQAPPQVQEAVLTNAALNLYTKYGNWQDVTSMLVDGKPISGNPSADKGMTVNQIGKAPSVSGFVQQVLAQINAELGKANKFLNQGAPTLPTTVNMPNLSQEGIVQAQKDDPLRADATAIVGNYGELVSRLFRPGGYVAPGNYDPTTGQGAVGIGAPTPQQAAAATGGQPATTGGNP